MTTPEDDILMTAGAGAWKLPPFYSYRTCGLTLVPPVEDDRDRVRRRSAVNGIKRELTRQGYLTKFTEDGVIGPKVRQAIIDFQIDEGIKVDGTVGPITGRRLIRDLVQLEQLGDPATGRIAIPHNYLGGVFRLESNFDPGAEGVDQRRSVDRGYAQISDTAFGHITDEQAYGDWPFVVRFGGDQLRHSKRRESDELSYAQQGRWDCAILNHNWPVGADQLYDTGEYPSFDAALYVWRVAVAAGKPW